MKKILLSLAVIGLLASCGNNDAEKDVAKQTTPQEVEKPTPPPVKHDVNTVDFKSMKKYNYVNAPKTVAAKSVVVNYDAKNPYAKPLEVVFTYSNGDTFKYVLQDFALWNNQAGKPRLVADASNTVWLQGQTKNGKFCEFVFFGDPKHNGSKISPNSYKNQIKYRSNKK